MLINFVSETNRTLVPVGKLEKPWQNKQYDTIYFLSISEEQMSQYKYEQMGVQETRIEGILTSFNVIG